VPKIPNYQVGKQKRLKLAKIAWSTRIRVFLIPVAEGLNGEQQ
jgi:hypothetical protein